jgi:hypothetical protein
VQTVPARAKSPAVEDIEVFLRAMVRAVDSSLLDEWERMFGRPPEPGAAPAETPTEATPEPDITRDERAFTVLVRGAIFQILRALAKKDWALAASLVSAPTEPERWTPAMFEAALAPFFQEHGAIRLDPSSRTVDKSRITKDTAGSTGAWDVVQVICDPGGDDDWALSCWIDLQASAREGKPIVVMRSVAR